MFRLSGHPTKYFVLIKIHSYKRNHDVLLFPLLLNDNDGFPYHHHQCTTKQYKL